MNRTVYMARARLRSSIKACQSMNINKSGAKYCQTETIILSSILQHGYVFK